jgi:pimeloyl-ACP methyl ester carboxylesterase
MSILNLALKTTGRCLNIYARISPKKAGAAGLNLFCLPFSKRLKTHQRDFLQSARYKTIDFNGKRIQIYRWGQGSRTALFVHGWASHSYRWKNYIESLMENDYTVYAFDAPSHGMSQGRMLTLPIYSDIIHTLVQEIGPLQGIVGHSFGGYAIINWLKNHPQPMDLKTVIMAAPGEVEDFMTMYKEKLGLSKHISQMIDQEFEFRIQKKPADFSALLLAKNFDYPCLIIHDEGDRDTDYRYSEKLNRVWKGSRLQLTQGLGHSLKSAEVTQSVIDFLCA